MKPHRIAFVVLLAWAGSVSASCGAAFCAINTSWDVQGAWPGEGTRLDLKYEYLKQDQPRAGSGRVAFGSLRRHHDEVSTENRSWVATLEHSFSPDWALGVSLPLVDRKHRHIHNHMGAQLPEAWDFTAAGDMRVLARYRLGESYGVNLGLKLPTGRYDERNGDGDLAERSLQPGTGTTDALLGAFFTHEVPERKLSFFTQGMLQLPSGPRDGYRPGRRLTLDAGLRYDVDEDWSLMLQLNAVLASRDRGREAEPGDTGGRALFLGPGASYALTRDARLYGFLQLPLYQYVNGVQITPRWAGVVGLNMRF